MKAVSLNADYVNWFDLSQPYNHLIKVTEAEGRDVDFEEISPIFQHAAIADSITNPYAREFGTTILVFTDAKINIRSRLQKEIEDRKNFR